MQVRFVVRTTSVPERLVCEAEIIFGDGPLQGMKLVGFSLWRSPEGETYVTFPSRAFGAGSERRFFDYLRHDGDGAIAGPMKRVKGWIIEQWQEQGRPGFEAATSAAGAP